MEMDGKLDGFEVIVNIEVISAGYHYLLLRSVDDGSLHLVRRWEVYDSDAGEPRPDENEEWEFVRGDQEISVEGVLGMSS